MALKKSKNADPQTTTASAEASGGPAGKLGTLAALLQRPKGATLAQLMEATGWQAHSIRGAMAGALSKRHGLRISSEKIDGTRVYRAAPGTKA